MILIYDLLKMMLNLRMRGAKNADSTDLYYAFLLFTVSGHINDRC